MGKKTLGGLGAIEEEIYSAEIVPALAEDARAGLPATRQVYLARWESTRVSGGGRQVDKDRQFRAESFPFELEANAEVALVRFLRRC